MNNIRPLMVRIIYAVESMDGAGQREIADEISDLANKVEAIAAGVANDKVVPIQTPDRLG